MPPIPISRGLGSLRWTARVTAALRRCGFEGSQGIDHVFVDGAACPVLLADLTTCVGQALALNWLSSPHVVGLFIAPPCGTCSRAREILLPDTGAPCPAPLRTFEFPDGLPNLSGSNLVRVNKANQLYHFSSTLCRGPCRVWCWPWKIREAASSVSFFEYLEKIELYCSKENYNLGIFKRA